MCITYLWISYKKVEITLDGVRILDKSNAFVADYPFHAGKLSALKNRSLGENPVRIALVPGDAEGRNNLYGQFANQRLDIIFAVGLIQIGQTLEPAVADTDQFGIRRFRVGHWGYYPPGPAASVRKCYRPKSHNRRRRAPRPGSRNRYAAAPVRGKSPGSSRTSAYRNRASPSSYWE